jgi:hypothetical protein
MRLFVVVAHEVVDIRTYGDRGPRNVPGDVADSKVVWAESQDEALQQVAADLGMPEFVGVVELPEYKVKRVRLGYA